MPTYLSPGVYVEELESGSRPIEGVGTAVAEFVGRAEKGLFNTPTLVTNWTQFTNNFGEFVEGAYLAQAVYGYFQNGGGAAYIVRIGSEAGQVPAQAQLTSGADQSVGAYSVKALNAGGEGNSITVEIADSTESSAEGDFKLVVNVNGSAAETYDPVTSKRGRTNVVTVVNAASQLIRLEETSKTAVESVTRGSIGLQGGGDGSSSSSLNPGDYMGDAASRTGVGGLEAIDEVTMVSVPDLMSAYQAGAIDLEGVKAVQLAMISHCELMGDRMAILDPPPGLDAQGIKNWRVEVAGYDSKFATLYWPWIKVFDPASGSNILVPPSGHV